MIDFSKLSRPQKNTAPIDPLEIFRRTPNVGGAPNALWTGQSEALKLWHANRNLQDNLIVLNTGAGKSIVGLMAAQSLVNEGIQNVLFVCSTIDLVEQTAREAEKLGLNYTTRTTGKYSNDLFETGRSFCITTYASVFAGTSTFRKTNLGGIVFDDAHVSERLIRDSLTVRVGKTDHPALYAKLVEIIRPEFDKVKKSDHFKFILDDVVGATTLCPPSTAFKNSASIIEAFRAYEFRRHDDLLHSFIQLYEHIKNCAIYVSPREIEITPPFLPNQHFTHVWNCQRRIFLSATMDYATDFVRAFGKREVNRIEPDNDAGNGERLIILASNLAEPDGKVSLGKDLSGASKVLVAVPSYPKAGAWDSICSPPQRANFSAELNTFRTADRGAFCLVSRVDGIDLPQDACRIMIIDGSPSGSNSQEKYQVEVLQMLSQHATKLSTRLTQLLGRINRGRSDYGAFVLYGTDLNNWCKNDRNIALLPTLIRKQFLLGQSLQEQIGKSTNAEIRDLIKGVIGKPGGQGRDKEWLKFYSETIDGLEVSDDAIEMIRQREERLSVGAHAESEFMSALWHGDTQHAREVILHIIDEIAPVDSKLAGWYDLWVGMTYEMDGDEVSAGTHYSRARSRLTHKLNVPLTRKFNSEDQEVEAKSAMHKMLLEANLKGPKAIGDVSAKLRIQLATLKNKKATSNQHEEACRMIGELLGFETARPDNVYKKGPDVVWSDGDANFLLAFELKTQKKDDDAKYKKDEIGQALNHIEWLKENYSDYQFSGVVVLGPVGQITDNTSPGESLFLLTVEEMARAVESFIARLDDMVGRTSLERWHIATDVGNLPEFQITGFSKSFTARPMKKLI